jgi:hypothetical protein
MGPRGRDKKEEKRIEQTRGKEIKEKNVEMNTWINTKQTNYISKPRPHKPRPVRGMRRAVRDGS